MRIQRFEDLEAWKIARQLTKDVYGLVKRESFGRDWGLKDQLCRASVSIMSNIAEGFERDGDREFVSFLSIAKGSAGETRSLLYVALDQSYIGDKEFRLISARAVENSRVISGLSSYLRQSELKGRKFK